MRKTVETARRAAALLLSALLLSAYAPAPAYGPVTDLSAGETVLGDTPVYPVLLPGESQGVLRVRWCAGGGGPCMVHYAPDDGGGLPPDHAVIPAEVKRAAVLQYGSNCHTYTAALPVEPGVAYLYGLSPDETPPETLYRFRAPAADSLSAIFTSDMHIWNGADGARYQAVLQQGLDTLLTASGGARGLDMICCAGDVVDSSDCSMLVPASGVSALRHLPFVPAAGNHDYYGALYEYFDMPNRAAPTEDYWFRQSGVLFLVLNCRFLNYGQHIDFLRETMAAQGEDSLWRVVLMHYSLESNGSHGRDGQVLQFRDQLAPVFSELDIDLVFSGHDHEYDRSPLLSAAGPAESSGPDLVKAPGETLYISLPCATGMKFYPQGTQALYPPVMEALDDEAGYLLAEFDPAVLTLRTFSAVSGEMVDGVTLRRANSLNKE